jgi:hypothetical protein
MKRGEIWVKNFRNRQYKDVQLQKGGTKIECDKEDCNGNIKWKSNR